MVADTIVTATAVPIGGELLATLENSGLSVGFPVIFRVVRHFYALSKIRNSTYP